MLPYKKVTIDLRRITDTESFHAVFAETLGFPYFYGKNMARKPVIVKGVHLLNQTIFE